MSDVCIVIPTFNDAEVVGNAVESALAQEPECDVVVVDDGSTDDTAARLRAFGDRIRYTRQENRGCPAAKNAGLRLARARFVLFLDSDDVLLPGKVAADLAGLAADPQAGLSYSGWRCVGPDGVVVLERRVGVRGQVLRHLLTHALALPSTGVATLRRAVLEACGGFDESLAGADDFNLWCRLADHGVRFTCVDRVLFEYRIRPASLSNEPARQRERAPIRALERFYESAECSAEARALRGEAFARFHFLSALAACRRGDAAQGRDHFAAAGAAWPGIFTGREWVAETVGASALHPASRLEPIALIDCAFDCMPRGARDAKGLRRLAHGRYHAAGAFVAHAAGDDAAVRRHLAPALLQAPGLLLNRGFLRVAWDSVARRRRRSGAEATGAR